MSDHKKAVEIIRPRLTIGREDGGSDMHIKLDGEPIVTIHYIYGYIDNATQHVLADQIARMFGYTKTQIEKARTP